MKRRTIYGLTMEILCRRGCGKRMMTTRRPIGVGVVARQRWERLHGICKSCLTPEERKELLLP